MTEVKYCKDCKFCKRSFIDIVLGFGWEYAKCTTPAIEPFSKGENSRIDLVHPSKKVNQRNSYYSCKSNRGYECGVAAKFFEPKVAKAE